MHRGFPVGRVAVVLEGLLCAPVCAGDPMTGEEIERLISGNTTYGKHEIEGFTGYSYNRTDGTAVGRDTRDGETRYKKSRNVMRGDIHVFTWTHVVPGNPENL